MSHAVKRVDKQRCGEYENSTYLYNFLCLPSCSFLAFSISLTPSPKVTHGRHFEHN